MAGMGIGAGISQKDGHAVPPALEGQQMEGGRPATPEEQAEYEQYVRNAMEVIYPAGERGQMSKSVQANLNGEFSPEMQQMLAAVEPPINPQSPIDTIGASAALIMAFLAGSAGQQGKPLDEGIMLEAGLDVVEVLANDGEQAGMFEVSEKDIEHAFYRGCDIYRYIGPNVDQQALAAEFEQIAAADRAGQLDKVIPGASRMQQAA